MFTKLHKEERDLLFKTNSVVAYEVYMHLKDKYSYFKAECYDLTRCISDYLDVPERTIKDAIKRLKTVGLISTTKKGKVNIYSFPILNKIEGKETKEEMIETPQVAVTGCTSLSKPIEEKNDTQPQQVEEKPTEAIKTVVEEDFITDEDKYGIDVVDLIDENPEIINALNAVVEYRCGDRSKLMEVQGANSKIERIVKSKSLDANFINRVERFCADYIKQYTEYVINNVKVKQIA